MNGQVRLVRRNRAYLALAVAATVAVGVASRRHPGLFPEALGKYPGDVLWAQTVYWGVGFLWPTMSVARLSACALSISYADEFSQLYQADWANRIRSTTFGHLVFGSTFSWADMLSYTVGVSLCALVELIVLKVGRARS
jgi:hypothetical protein